MAVRRGGEDKVSEEETEGAKRDLTGFRKVELANRRVDWEVEVGRRK